ncbi:hypothetical protein QTI05_22535 [Variovorax sp. J22R193]|uniref:hypothetical protein n=1 Tax=Variovorax fucosicus TaxID=3053517 RepID=UPI002576E635|nr:hypothetical protein [Variovorax sp. J22R193]MDM0041835.1 hypothetical protein [Variovorax sp. J22R193]
MTEPTTPEAGLSEREAIAVAKVRNGLTALYPREEIDMDAVLTVVHALQIRAALASRPAVAAVSGEPATFLCRIWGEDIKHTLTALVSDWAGVRRFCVEHWTGSEDAADYDGSLTLDNLKNEFDEHEADERGGAYNQEWEIGGVSIERVCDCSALASTPAIEPRAPVLTAIAFAISVFNDVLGDIADWEDQALADAVREAIEKLTVLRSDPISKSYDSIARTLGWPLAASSQAPGVGEQS